MCVCVCVCLPTSHHFLKQLVVYSSVPYLNSRVYSNHFHVATHKKPLHYSSRLSGRSLNGCAIIYVTLVPLMDISLFPIIWTQGSMTMTNPLHMEVQLPRKHAFIILKYIFRWLPLKLVPTLIPTDNVDMCSFSQTTSLRELFNFCQSDQ